MNAMIAGPSLYTQAKKRLYSLARVFQGPGKTDVIATVTGHDTACRKAGTLPVTVALHNRGPGHAFEAQTLNFTWRPEREPSRVVHETSVNVPVQILRGQTETVHIGVPVPSFLGRFQLALGEFRLPTPIEVLARPEDDIDYVAVYKNTDLKANDWHVVGPSTQAEHQRLAALKLEQLKAAGLTPDSAVFDVGCGTGQLALALEPFLSDRGFYFGCDIGAEGIAHCRARFRRPNFRFDINGMTTLPRCDRTFDFITLFSVFTHTLADETMMLLHEMKQTLKPTGCVYADIYLSDFVDRYAGNRGRIEYERQYWERMLALVGYRFEIAHSWQVEPHVKRELFILKRV